MIEKATIKLSLAVFIETDRCIQLPWPFVWQQLMQKLYELVRIISVNHEIGAGKAKNNTQLTISPNDGIHI